MPSESMEEIVALCKHRGFIFQSADLYGGLKGVYDYGPLGVELKNNLKQSWWRAMVYERDDVEGLDAALIGHQKMFEYSGHVGGFNDPLVECKNCKHRMRADHMKNAGQCDVCGSDDVTPPRQFNMMFKTQIGPVEDDSSTGYLRPETAQHIFSNFKHVVDSTSRRPPFGIAQMGKAFRNEIVARNFIFRVREFEQMELEFFVEPGTDEQWHNTWLEERLSWWESQGVPRDQIKVEDVPKEDLAHYSKRTFDLCYKYPHGYDEIEGVANRMDYDLGNHTKGQSELNIQAKVKENTDSNAKLAVQNQQTKEWYVPFVIEPSAGVDRGVLAVLCEAYTKEKLEDNKERVVLKLKPHLSPIKAAIIPLAKNNEEIVSLAKQIKQDLQKVGLGRVLFENKGNVGKAYRRHDEVGTPLCITVDFETLEQSPATVTVRDRDTMEQTRVEVDKLVEYFINFYQNAR